MLTEKNMNDNFELKKAYHAKQVAYDEMSNAREKLSDLSQALSEYRYNRMQHS